MKQKKWKNLNEVPRVFMELEGVHLDLDQINYIYKDLAVNHPRKRRDGRIDPNYHYARKTFLAQHEREKKGNKCIYLPKGGVN